MSRCAEAALGRALGSLDVRSHRYERARTQLVWAALHRRRRQRGLAQKALVVAREEFAALGAAGWRAFADRELDRLGLHHDDTGDLTPSERRIAELASSGLTTATIATRLSISAKTVEAHLTRSYHKLGIHSRAELGRWIAEHPTPDPNAVGDHPMRDPKFTAMVEGKHRSPWEGP